MKRLIIAGLVVLALCLPAAAQTTIDVTVQTAEGLWTLQSAATTGNGTPWNTRASLPTTIYFVAWSDGCSAGAVTLETAATAAYAGTWAPLVTVSWSAASKTDVIQVFAPIGVIRARISTNIVGGTVTVTAYGLGR